MVKEVRESDIVDLFNSILNSSYAGQVVTEYIITSAMKLTTRLSDPAQVERLRRLLLAHQTNLNVEIQQRAVEYGNLFGYDAVRRGVLEHMPPPEIREEQRVLGQATKKKTTKAPSKKKPSQVTEQDMLLDLMGDSGMPVADISSTVNGQQHNADLLADILGGGASISSPPPQTVSPAPGAGAPAHSNMASIMDLFDTPSTSSTPAPSAPARPASAANDLFSGMTSPPPQPTGQTPTHAAFNKDGLVVTFQVQRNASAVQVIAKFRNNDAFEHLSGVGLQAAVPKSQRLQLQAISSSEIGGGAEATQQMRVVSVQGVSLGHLLKGWKMNTNEITATTSEITTQTEDQLWQGWTSACD